MKRTITRGRAIRMASVPDKVSVALLLFKQLLIQAINTQSATLTINPAAATSLTLPYLLQTAIEHEVKVTIEIPDA